jgi:hypothetical protein
MPNIFTFYYFTTLNELKIYDGEAVILMNFYTYCKQNNYVVFSRYFKCWALIMKTLIIFYNNSTF